MDPKEIEQLLAEDDTIDIKKYVSLLLKNWYWFIVSFVLCMSAAYTITHFTENIYEIDATILIRDDKNKPNQGAEALMSELSLVNNSKSIQNEIGILKSYTLAYSTLEKLPRFHTTFVEQDRGSFRKHTLYLNRPFTIKFDTTFANPIDVPIEFKYLGGNKYAYRLEDEDYSSPIMFGEPVANGDFGFTIFPAENANLKEFEDKIIFVSRNNLNRLANGYRNKVKVDLVDKNASLISLSSTGNSAEQEADYINTLIEEYVQQGLNEKNQIAKNTIGFIDEQLYGMRDSLNKAENNLRNFRAENKILDIDKEASILLDKLKELQANKATIDINTKYYAYLKNYLAKKDNYTDVVAPYTLGISDLQLNNILSELTKLSSERDFMKFSYKENNPAMVQLDKKIAGAKATLVEKINSLIATNNMANTEFSQQMKELEAKISSLPNSEQLLLNKTKVYELLDKMYTYLLEKKSEASIARASNISDCKIVDPAFAINAQIKQPKPKMNYMLGFALALFIPFIIIILRDYFDDKIRTIKEITSKLPNVSMLATLNHSAIRSDLPVIERPKSHLSESFRVLRTNLNYVTNDETSKIILVTSLISGEGKTFCASNLSAIYAASGKRTLLIGLDLRKPKVQMIFEITNSKGMSSFLSKQSPFADAIKPTTVPNLSIAVSGPIPPSPAELIGSPKMKEFLEEAKKHYDCIIIDTPPIGIVTDARILFNLVDLVLFVTRIGVSPKDSVNFCSDLYESLNGKLAIAINDFDSKLSYSNYSKYHYNYNYSYGREYKHDYYEN